MDGCAPNRLTVRLLHDDGQHRQNIVCTRAQSCSHAFPSPSDCHLQCFVHLTIRYAAADEYWCLLQDYFEFDGGSSKAAQARGIKPETQAAIQRWLEDNQ